MYFSKDLFTSLFRKLISKKKNLICFQSHNCNATYISSSQVNFPFVWMKEVRNVTAFIIVHVDFSDMCQQTKQCPSKRMSL